MYIYIYIFSFLNFNPKNIPGNDGEAGLGLLQRAFATKDSGLADPQATQPTSPCLLQDMGETVEVGVQLGTGPGVVALGLEAGLRLGIGGAAHVQSSLPSDSLGAVWTKNLHRRG